MLRVHSMSQPSMAVPLACSFFGKACSAVLRHEWLRDGINSDRRCTRRHRHYRQLAIVGLCVFVLQRGKWRKAAGVEPTQEWLTPLTGFEARPHHRARLPSMASSPLCVAVAFLEAGIVAAAYLVCSGGWLICPLPHGIGPQQVGVAQASGVAHAVKIFQHLNGALAPKASRIAEGRCLHLAVGCGLG